MSRLFAVSRADHASPIAIGLLVAANLVPLAGVLYFGWDLVTLVALYWLENGVVGVFAIGRILTADAVDPNPTPMTINGRPVSPGRLRSPVLARALLTPFFCIHYGMFWLVHGVFVWFALPQMFAGSGRPVVFPDLPVVLVAGVALFASHAASFAFNWMAGGEHLASTPAREMQAPYARVIILHVTIVLGAFAVSFLGAPIWALVVMVVTKTFIDLAAHLGERRRLALRMTGPGMAFRGTA